MARFTPPVPPSRPEGAGMIRRWLLARRNLLRSHPERLYSGWLAETRLPWGSTFAVMQPDLVRRILVERPEEFPKYEGMARIFRPLLGDSVFVSNGERWKAQRRIVDRAFAGGRLRQGFPAMAAAAARMEARLARAAPGPVDMEWEATLFAADVIFRTMFSTPIEEDRARAIFEEFQRYQRATPHVRASEALNLPAWLPRAPKLRANAAARRIRRLLAPVVARRRAEIEAGDAPDDMMTAIWGAEDAETGMRFTEREVVDHVAVFFLAGHESSASAIAWTLWLLANDRAAQERVRAEAEAAADPGSDIGFSTLKSLEFTRDVFREGLRLYSPVQAVMREAGREQHMRDRRVRRGDALAISLWHLHRHRRLWERPDEFDPDRWRREAGRDSARTAYFPFSAGPRVCPGAGFAMQEGVLALATVARRFELAPSDGRAAMPMAHLTVRSEGGVWVDLRERETG